MVLQHAISRLRYEQNLTQEEVARKLQLSQSVVGKIERNAMDVKLTDLVRYVNTLGGKLSLQVDLPSGKKIFVPLTNFEHSKAFENPDSVLYSITQTTKNRLAAAFCWNISLLINDRSVCAEQRFDLQWKDA